MANILWIPKQTLRASRPGWGWLFALLIGLSTAGLFLSPWSLQDTSLAVVHGLCSQRPSHSFWFGDWRLPFDARMTGIYGGCLGCQLYLLASGRFKAAGLPSLPILTMLVFFVVVMGFDGVNSTLDDVGLPRLYEPRNDLRFLTGALTGTTLAVILWLLSGAVLWRPSERTTATVLRGWRDLFALSLGIAALGGLVASGWQPIYGPLTVALVGSAVVVLFTLSLVFVQLARGRIGAASSPRDLSGAAVVGLLAAYGVMLLIGGSRFLLELSTGVQPRP